MLDKKKSYVAIGNVIPERGMILNLWRFESDFGHFFPASVLTSPVESVEKVVGNLFRVETHNSIYYIQVIIVAWTNVYVAFGLSSPILGGRMKCIAVKPVNSGLEVMTVKTSNIRRIEYIGSIFKIETENSVYYVQPSK
jgi:hypothetical protein